MQTQQANNRLFIILLKTATVALNVVNIFFA